MNDNKYTRTIEVNICNDHISGLLGESILKFFLKEKLIARDDKFYTITEKGWDFLEIIGIDVNNLLQNKKIIEICTDNKDGILFEHIGSRLGVLIKEKWLELTWLIYYHDKLILTEKGENGLKSLGINIKRVNVNLNT
jgi:predicted transcriptional regulator